MAKEDKESKLSLEDKLKRLEEITTLIEENDNLDGSISLYAEGTQIAKECMAELETAKGKIFKIQNGEEKTDV